MSTFLSIVKYMGIGIGAYLVLNSVTQIWSREHALLIIGAFLFYTAWTA